MTMKQEKKRIYLRAALALAALLVVLLALDNLSFVPSMLLTVLRKGAIYALVAVSMNLLNGFTGLFSLGQAGFMLLGAYTYAILTVPVSAKDTVYYLFGGSAVKFSLPDLFGGVDTPAGLILGVLLAIILGGCVAAFFAYLIGLPVLRLKSDYLAIATLGFAEIIRAIFQWQALGPITNGANMITQIPTFNNFNITDSSGKVVFYLSSFFPMLIMIICVAIIVMLINSSYGRAFKAIRDDEIAAEAMGINLAKHKMQAFLISSFFAGIGGALLAMFQSSVQANTFTSTMTYEILLIVVIGGIGSITGSILGSFLYIASSEWWLRFLDDPVPYLGVNIPFMRGGFRMLVFSVVIMIVVLFFRQGIMGNKEITDLLKPRKKTKEVAK